MPAVDCPPAPASATCTDRGVIPFVSAYSASPKLIAQTISYYVHHFPSSFVTERLELIRGLEANWDSYGSTPFSTPIVDAVESLASDLECKGWPVSRIAPSADQSIILDATTPNGSVRWEFDDDGDVGLTIEKQGGPVYHDCTVDSIPSLDALLDF